MKIKILLVFAIAIILLSGCSNEKIDINQPTSVGSTEQSSDKIKYTIGEFEDTNTKLIELSLPENSGLGFADIHNDNIFLSVGYSKNGAFYIAFSVLDITSGISKELYRGEGRADNWHSNFHVLPSGDYAFQTQEMILIFDKDDMTIKKEISLPSDGYSYSLSNNGTKIAFSKDHNLYIADIDQITNPKLLVKGKKLKGPDGRDCGGPGNPMWSEDDGKLSYILFTYEESEGFGIVNSDGSGNIELKPRGFIPDYAYFYKNSEKLLCGQVTFGHPKLYSYDIKENKLADITIEEGWRNFMPHPIEGIIAFSREDENFKGQLFLNNLESKQVQPISPVMDNALYIKWDNTGKKILGHLNRNKIAVIEISEQKDNLIGSNEKVFSASSLILIDSSFESIDNLLKGQKEVVQVSWSPDKRYVAFSVGNMGWDDRMYLWKSGESSPFEVEGVKDRICSFLWSPNNNYVLADSGSSITRSGYIVDIQNQAKTDVIGYVGEPYWSPDSKWIAVGQMSDIKPNVAIELSGTVDMCLYNIASKEIKIIVKGTADYYFSPKKWDSDGRLTYLKINFKDPNKQEVMTYRESA